MDDAASRPSNTTRTLVSGLARTLRHAPDRLLHGPRHRAALRRVARQRPRAVLIVCRGNVCRSPYAAARLRMALGPGRASQVAIDSAGFLAPGRSPPADAVSAAGLLGVGLAEHRSRQLTGDLIRQADLVLVMEPEQRRAIRSIYPRSPAAVVLLGDFDPLPVLARAIPDPYGHPVETFLECYRQIDRCIKAVVCCLSAVPEPEPRSAGGAIAPLRNPL